MSVVLSLNYSVLTSFVFCAIEGVQLKGGSSEKRVELLSEFHAHMAGILADIANTPTSGTSLELKRQPSSAVSYHDMSPFR